MVLQFSYIFTQCCRVLRQMDPFSRYMVIAQDARVKDTELGACTT